MSYRLTRSALQKASALAANSNFSRLMSGISTIKEDDANSQFYVETDSGSARAFVEYKIIDPNTIELVSTNVPESFRGKGVGKKLAEAVFKHCLAKNFHINVKCEFLQTYFDQNLSQNEEISKRVSKV